MSITTCPHNVDSYDMSIMTATLLVVMTLLTHRLMASCWQRVRWLDWPTVWTAGKVCIWLGVPSTHGRHIRAGIGQHCDPRITLTLTLILTLTCDGAGREALG